MSWLSDIFKSRETIIREYEYEKETQRRIAELQEKQRQAGFVNYDSAASSPPELSRLDIPGDVFYVIYETIDYVAIPVWRIDEAGNRREMCDILSKTGNFLHATRNHYWAKGEILKLQLEGFTKHKSLV